MILVDTSLWISHLRGIHTELPAWLESGLVVTHPFVIAELALGSIRNRNRFLRELARLPSLPVARDEEVMRFIEGNRLASSGLGLVDVHLLAASIIHSTRLESEDRRLFDHARRFGLG